MLRSSLILALVLAVSAKTGFDGIQSISEAGFKCLKSHGYDFFIARIWESSGNFDNTGYQNIKNARNTGWTDIDGYVFPCLASNCAPPANQVEAVINKLKSTGAKVNYVWLDIEIYHWSADHAHNRNFITAMVNEIEVFLSEYQ
ncbi:hypothetical protein WR25_13092 [Diploscapter pachys]|uniref:Lysozyme n=1 Tax=Diploscapter pachys TaxID=2018661 RepID=A0A2A2KFA6_9BILA|nr:hypothetical protein WR25_13092 [Diploscapter pachys]